MSHKLGKYVVLDEIGRGGMATVYRARQESLDRIVAIKELNLSSTTSDIKAKERFQMEARAAASLDHPNIITIHDFWEKGSKAYIAMEYVEGLELKEALDHHGALDSVLAAQVCIQVCAALSYAHERGMIHRDVKPGNIMLSARGDVKLADFGIVFIAGTADLTTTGQIIGTPSYMSPEQIRGEDPGPVSDIFSLGIVLYECVTGAKPFSGPNDVALTHAIIRKRPVRPRRLNSRISRRLSGIIMKCLRKKSRRRFATMDELAAALQRTLPRRAPDAARALARLVTGIQREGEAGATVPMSPSKAMLSGRSIFIPAVVTIVLAAVFLLAVLSGSLREATHFDSGGALGTVPLMIVAYPWAEVTVDGSTLGYTPSARPFQVSPGRHTLVLTNTRFGSRTFKLDITREKPISIRVDFLQEKK
ncbi:MAG TPA: serine/threonine protein kinase [Proteobacteria bacterium]|nr:serine/threonine-protein kinase PrkC [bacterium BMS3Abin14]HDL53494.1 serine/threonine protein kinase [Pseudomonadota bacterium]